MLVIECEVLLPLVYKHPSKDALIENIKLVTPSLSQKQRTQTRKQKGGYEYISVFVSFTYVSKEDEQLEFAKRKRSLPQKEHDDMDISGSKGERHAFVLCPVVRNGQCCRRTGKIRDSGMIHHDCPILTQRTITSLMKVREPHDQHLDIDQEVDYRKTVRNLLVSFIAGTPISFRLIASQQFKNLLFGIVRIARSHESVPAESLLPTLTVHTIPSMLKSRASQLYQLLLSSLNNAYVSINIDSATIGHNNYLAVTLRQLQSQSPVYFIQFLNTPSGKEGYARQLCSIIEFLHGYNIFVTSICCDGASAQVSSITTVRQLLNDPTIPTVERAPTLPLHIPCFNHRVNLALQYAVRSPALSRVVPELQKFASAASTKAYRKTLGKTAPSFILTRWFSLWNIASFIRLHRDKIIKESYLSQQILLDILKAEVLLTPFTELTLFFESDKVQLSSVYPALLRALTQYSYIATSPYFHTGEWLHATMHCMVEIFNHCFTGTIGSLISLAFWLQPYGRLLYTQNLFLSGYRIDTPLSECFSLQFACFPFHCLFLLDNQIRLLFILRWLIKYTAQQT